MAETQLDKIEGVVMENRERLVRLETRVEDLAGVERRRSSRVAAFVAIVFSAVVGLVCRALDF